MTIPAPPSVEMPGFQPFTGPLLTSDNTIWAFDEKQGFRLDSDLPVNIIWPGTYGPSNPVYTTSNEQQIRGTIPAGTLVNSHFIHFQPIGSRQVVLGDLNTNTPAGSITFDQDILGLITLSRARYSFANLDDTDGLLGSPTTLYAPTKDARGAELDPGGLDQITWLGTDLRTLQIDQLRAKFPGDQIRIITAAIPEPSPLIIWSLLGALGITVGWWRRRRR